MGIGRVTPTAGEVVEDRGHTWLQAQRRSLAARRAAVGLVIALGAGVAMPAAEARGVLAGLVIVVAVFVVGAWLLLGVWRRSHTRVGVGPVGVLVQRGARTRQLAWQAVDGIVVEPAGPRSSTPDQSRRRRQTVAVAVAGDGHIDRVALRLRAEDVKRWQRAVADLAPGATHDPG